MSKLMDAIIMRLFLFENQFFDISCRFMKYYKNIGNNRPAVICSIYKLSKLRLKRYRATDQLPAHGRDSGVSPVVGVMLMLAITLILAAIISGMTGGIAQSQHKPPQLLFEATMVNDRSDPANSFLDVRIISISEGVPTKDLKFQTEWQNQNGQIHHSTVTPLSKNVNDQTYPLGYGPGVQTGMYGGSNFGNYTILAGSRLNVNESVENSMNAVLTDSWNDEADGITEGTPIRIQFVHVPSGAIIADKTITAEKFDA
jgi:archaeal type IV pilus assembly protein PilA